MWQENLHKSSFYKSLGVVVAMLWLLMIVVNQAAGEAAGGSRHGLLKVSENKRFLVQEDGTPFFWLGDTAWELFHRLNREEADRYLENRAAKGFTVIQAVAIAELDGHTDPNPYGHLPLVDLDPARPAVKDGPDNDYWDHVDYIVEQGQLAGAVHRLPADLGPLLARQGEGRQAAVHAAERGGLRRVARPAATGTRHLIWILGGDRPVENDDADRRSSAPWPAACARATAART